MKTTELLLIVAIVGVALGVFTLSDVFAEEPKKNSMSSMMGMCSMMDKIPKDVTIRSLSPQIVPVGKEAKITILVTDKVNKKPVLDADVPIMIERGSPMSTMDMIGSMVSADELGGGKYILKFTPDKKGVYTIHTHVIPEGKSMMSMMQNHIDIGIIAK